ncbi:MAG: MFS transporter [Myxococcota bacterium]|jgi:sugar phosphate permease
MATPADSSSERIELRHFAFLGLLTMLNVVNFVDRQALPSFANFIVPELGLSATQFSYLTGIFFTFFYATMGLFTGVLADLFHRPRLIAAGLGVWSVLTAATGAATSFATIAAPRMLIGIGESVCTPTAMSMLSDRFPASRLGLASGIYYMGVPIGVSVSALVAGYLGPALGWRHCFYLLGAIGVVFAVGMWFVPETPRRHADARSSATAQRQSLGEIVRTLGRALGSSPALVCTMAGGVAFHFILGAAAFDQIWLVEERGFERAEILRISGWLSLAGGIAGNLLGGLGSDWFLRRTGMGRPMFLALLLALFAPLSFAYRLAEPSSLWFWIAMTMGSVQLGMFYGPTFASVQELVPPNIRATVVGFYIMLLNVVGLGVGNTGAGVLVDRVKAAGGSDGYSQALVLFTAASMLALPLFVYAGRRFARDRDALYAQLGASGAA